MAIGEAFLSAFLQVLFDRLASKSVIDFILPGDDIQYDLKKLEKTMNFVKPVLNHAEYKQFEDKQVKIWLDELKDAAYDADDVLNEFDYEALRSKMEADFQSSPNWVSSLIPASLKPASDSGMESKLKEITERFEELAKRISELGLKDVAAESTIVPVETSSVVDESHVCGRDADKEKIIKLLLDDDSGCNDNFSVVPIVGMGGIGKTTLAQIVYNDTEVESHFKLKAWVCVTDKFDVKRITKDVLLSVDPSQTSDFDDLNRLQVKVQRALKGMKFLIVLDDVWSKKYGDWNVLQNPFRAGAPGSKFIVTTRDGEVASMMGTVHEHRLKNLSYEDCWSVFVQHAFSKRNNSARTKLEVVGKKIVEKCDGLPLAARTLGGLLRSKQEEDEWEEILNNKIWDLPMEGNDILPALRLSYHHLPSHLKRCFAYCSIFPEDYEFAETELVQLWMAEGLVKQTKQVEGIGLGYFRELASRSFFQRSTRNESRFVMHDLISDLAQFVAGKTCFRLEGNLDIEKQCEISRKARHSSYVSSDFDGVNKFDAFHKAEGLRTFLPLSTCAGNFLTNSVLNDLLPKLRSLRVLSLRGYYIPELPDSIGGLKHLRYLNLSDTNATTLPESMSSLYNLQTLYLENCSNLKKLPTRMQNLINLRHLCITNGIEEMPPRVGNLKNLQILTNFVVGNGISGSGIRELGELQHLREKLWISRLENVIDAQDANEAKLKDKRRLDELGLVWSSESNDQRDEVENEVIEMLQPHNRLKNLTIRCYGGTRFPTWMGHPSFSNMVLLRLEDCVKCTALPPLGLLSSLEDLCIKRMNGVSTVGIDFNGEGCLKPFPSLKTLSFEDMVEWEDWLPCGGDRQVEVFPCLCKLSIIRCPKLSGKLPEHLPSLEDLIIVGCWQLVVSISSLPKLCDLDIRECQDMVQSNLVDLSSLKSMHLSNSSMLTSPSEGFVQSLTKAEDLVIVGCTELTSLWQNDVGLLQHLTSLRCLIIMDCPKFVSLEAEEAEQQLGVPRKLESLELSRCDKLEKLQGLYRLTSLRDLKISGCPRLVEFPETNLPSVLRNLSIDKCNALESLHQAMMNSSYFASLDYLRISNCDSLTSIARGQLPSMLKTLEIENCKNLQCLVFNNTSLSSRGELVAELFHNNTSLHYLRISECDSLTSIARGQLPSMLKTLHIMNCKNLHCLVEEEDSTTTTTTSLHNKSNNSSTSLTFLSSRGELPAALEHLCITNCPKLESVAEMFHNNTSLESIDIKVCKGLKSLPEGLHNLSHLCKFYLYGCPRVVSFPNGGLPTTSLRQLLIMKCEKLEALPNHMNNLTSLQRLTIRFCPGIVSFPKVSFPTNLTSLEIEDINNCKPLIEWGLCRLTSLQSLGVHGLWPDLVSFPDEKDRMVLPTSLTRLSIVNFPNLKCLSSKGLQKLTSLETFIIRGCPKLKSFPEDGLPRSLLQLQIYRCPFLKQQYDKDQGQDWLKISLIPWVRVYD